MASLPSIPVSVILTTYNRADLVIQAIESVLHQTYPDFEVLVINDGSTDHTRAVLEGITDRRVKSIHQINSGLPAARNQGIKLANGKYIAFLDDDDLWLPNKLARQMQCMKLHPEVDWVSCGYATIDFQGNYLGHQVNPWVWKPVLDLSTWLYGCPTIPSCVLVKKEWLTRANGFDEELSQSEDWDLWLRLSNQGCRMEWVRDMLCLYRVHPASMVHNTSRQSQNMVRVVEKFFNQPDLPANVKKQENKVLSAALLRGAARAFASGALTLAKEHIARAIQLDSTIIENDSRVLCDSLFGWIEDPIVHDPIQYQENVFNNLPEQALSVQKFRKPVFRYAVKISFVTACKQRRWEQARKTSHIMIRQFPGLFFDRQVASAFFELLLGKKMKTYLRRVFQKWVPYRYTDRSSIILEPSIDN